VRSPQIVAILETIVFVSRIMFQVTHLRLQITHETCNAKDIMYDFPSLHRRCDKLAASSSNYRNKLSPIIKFRADALKRSPL